MYGDPNKMAAAGKHYGLMTMADICAMPVREIMAPKAALFMWCTGPRMDLAFEAIKSWGLHYRGVAFVWVKTRKDGGIIGAQGIPPTAVKPITEFVLLATTNKTGRPFPLLDSKVEQVVLAPRGKHSEKPEEVRRRIENIYGADRKKIELFARKKTVGWTCTGDEVDGEKY
jgi:N6-adenosine-specific RNA methylase IME4